MAAPHVKDLVLHSPAGSSEVLTFTWPLQVGTGQDKHDNGIDIIDTIKFVCDELPGISSAFEEINLNQIDTACNKTMTNLVDRFNKAVDSIVALEKGTSLPAERLNKFAHPSLLRHILQLVYNAAVLDPDKLNNYEPFSPEVYGETSYELVQQMIKHVNVTTDDTFIDLGSGVGQVVLQMAGSFPLKACIGIEKADTPAHYAERMDLYFRQFMAWFGKRYCEYKLIKGDFLVDEHREKITSSTLVFVNNFAFGPNVDHQLKERFADLRDAARVVSSKSFCPLNFRITDRNLSDIGTIMHVSEIPPLKGSVSWTCKPVSYYLHVIDRTILERYFQRLKTQKGAENDHVGSTRTTRDRAKREANNHVLNNHHHSIAHALSNRTNSPANVNSHASINNNTTTTTTTNSTTSTTTSTKTRQQQQQQRSLVDMDNTSTESDNDAQHGHGNSMTNGPTTRKVWSDWCSSKGKSSQSDDDDTNFGSTTNARNARNLATQKKRKKLTRKAAVASKSAAAAQREAAARERELANMNALKESSSKEDAGSGNAVGVGGKGRKGRMKKGARGRKSLKIVGLDVLHKQTLLSTSVEVLSKKLPAAPGCVDQQLTSLLTRNMTHTELDIPEAPQDTPYALQILLDVFRTQYMAMMEQMKQKPFVPQLRRQIQLEQERKQRIKNRASQLDKQIKVLIDDSVALLKVRMNELGINVSSPNDLIAKAKEIVGRHKELQGIAKKIQSQVTASELEQKRLLKKQLQHLPEYQKVYGNGKTKLELPLSNGLELSEAAAHDLVLKEIANTLTQRKKLYAQVSCIEKEAAALEKVTEERRTAAALLAQGTNMTLAPAGAVAVSHVVTPTMKPATLTPANIVTQQQQQLHQPQLQQQPQPLQLTTTTGTTNAKSNNVGGILSSHGGHTKSSRRSRDHRTRSQEWPDVPDVGKIEESNPEVLAQKILETGRQIEAGKFTASSATGNNNTSNNNSNNNNNNYLNKYSQQHYEDKRNNVAKHQQQQQHQQHSRAANLNVESTTAAVHSNMNINMLDATHHHSALLMPAPNNMTSGKQQQQQQQQQHMINNIPTRGRGSHAKGGNTNNNNHNNNNNNSNANIQESPKVANFEDRLKSIITSALNEDQEHRKAVAAHQMPTSAAAMHDLPTTPTTTKRSKHQHHHQQQQHQHMQHHHAQQQQHGSNLNNIITVATQGLTHLNANTTISPITPPLPPPTLMQATGAAVPYASYNNNNNNINNSKYAYNNNHSSSGSNNNNMINNTNNNSNNNTNKQQSIMSSATTTTANTSNVNAVSTMSAQKYALNVVAAKYPAANNNTTPTATTPAIASTAVQSAQQQQPPQQQHHQQQQQQHLLHMQHAAMYGNTGAAAAAAAELAAFHQRRRNSISAASYEQFLAQQQQQQQHHQQQQHQAMLLAAAAAAAASANQQQQQQQQLPPHHTQSHHHQQQQQQQQPPPSHPSHPSHGHPPQALGHPNLLGLEFKAPAMATAAAEHLINASQRSSSREQLQLLDDAGMLPRSSSANSDTAVVYYAPTRERLLSLERSASRESAVSQPQSTLAHVTGVAPPSRPSSNSSQPDYTQVSPAKMALRRHLSQEKLNQQPSTAAAMLAASANAGIPMSTKTIGDLVNGEIERTLEISHQSIINAAVNMSTVGVDHRAAGVMGNSGVSTGGGGGGGAVSGNGAVSGYIERNSNMYMSEKERERERLLINPNAQRPERVHVRVPPPPPPSENVVDAYNTSDLVHQRGRKSPQLYNHKSGSNSGRQHYNSSRDGAASYHHSTLKDEARITCRTAGTNSAAIAAANVRGAHVALPRAEMKGCIEAYFNDEQHHAHHQTAPQAASAQQHSTNAAATTTTHKNINAGGSRERNSARSGRLNGANPPLEGLAASLQDHVMASRKYKEENEERQRRAALAAAASGNNNDLLPHNNQHSASAAAAAAAAAASTHHYIGSQNSHHMPLSSHQSLRPVTSPTVKVEVGVKRTSPLTNTNQPRPSKIPHYSHETHALSTTQQQQQQHYSHANNPYANANGGLSHAISRSATSPTSTLSGQRYGGVGGNGSVGGGKQVPLEPLLMSPEINSIMSGDERPLQLSARQPTTPHQTASMVGVSARTGGGDDDDVIADDESHWQHRVSSGFDRLVAFASTELDKTRRSIDTDTVPSSISCNTSPDSGITHSSSSNSDAARTFLSTSSTSSQLDLPIGSGSSSSTSSSVGYLHHHHHTSSSHASDQLSDSSMKSSHSDATSLPRTLKTSSPLDPSIIESPPLSDIGLPRTPSPNAAVATPPLAAAAIAAATVAVPSRSLTPTQKIVPTPAECSNTLKIPLKYQRKSKSSSEKHYKKKFCERTWDYDCDELLAYSNSSTPAADGVASANSNGPSMETTTNTTAGKEEQQVKTSTTKSSKSPKETTDKLEKNVESLSNKLHNAGSVTTTTIPAANNNENTNAGGGGNTYHHHHKSSKFRPKGKDWDWSMESNSSSSISLGGGSGMLNKNASKSDNNNAAAVTVNATTTAPAATKSN